MGQGGRREPKVAQPLRTMWSVQGGPASRLQGWAWTVGLAEPDRGELGPAGTRLPCKVKRGAWAGSGAPGESVAMGISRKGTEKKPRVWTEGAVGGKRVGWTPPQAGLGGCEFGWPQRGGAGASTPGGLAGAVAAGWPGGALDYRRASWV